MLPSFFGFTRFETNQTPGQAMLAWSLGPTSATPELDAELVRVVNDALSHAGPLTDALALAHIADDLLES